MLTFGGFRDHLHISMLRGVAYKRSGLYEEWPIRGVAYKRGGLRCEWPIRGVAFGVSSL